MNWVERNDGKDRSASRRCFPVALSMSLLSSNFRCPSSSSFSVPLTCSGTGFRFVYAHLGEFPSLDGEMAVVSPPAAAAPPARCVTAFFVSSSLSTIDLFSRPTDRPACSPLPYAKDEGVRVGRAGRENGIMTTSEYGETDPTLSQLGPPGVRVVARPGFDLNCRRSPTGSSRRTN